MSAASRAVGVHTAEAPISPADRDRIAHRSAQRLFRL
jgi:hypothetical protein